ncbi:hypothetical protein [Pseudomonas sp. Hg5Tf]|uniref:Uncharacterized protein n=1 Tax=Pseudomonas sp. Hg7Tf TaxID=3236988 RepID=A0AB39HW23_9PSED|nr:hypothetical protein [Pseudomonas sp. Hg5Tf]MDH2559910.1 hypothetical protein [Pseudomonas sp. Hg5Tf]
MTHMLYIVVLWIGLVILSILWVRALLRGRDLERQLYAGQPVDGLASPVRPEDIERYKRSQYFARIGGLLPPRGSSKCCVRPTQWRGLVVTSSS